MELLALASNVLYNRDILEKQAEIESLRKQLARYEMSTRAFRTCEEWTESLQTFWTRVNKAINSLLSYMNGKCMLVWMKPQAQLLENPAFQEFVITIDRELCRLTENQEWAHNTAPQWLISLISFYHTNSNIHSNTLAAAQVFMHTLYNNTISQTPKFRCTECENVSGYSSHDGLCITCENKVIEAIWKKP